MTDLPDCEQLEQPSPPKSAFRSRGSSFTASQGCFRWTCPHCPFVAQATNARQVTLQKSHHMNACHFEAPCEDRRRSAHAQLALGENTTQVPVTWQCPLCSAHLKKSDGDKLNHSTIWTLKSRHRADYHPRVSQETWNVKIRAQCASSFAFRNRCRVARLNEHIGSRVAVSTQFEHFTWPRVDIRRGKRRGRMLSSLRCTKCLTCLKNVCLAAKHKCCSPDKKRDQLRARSLAALKAAETVWKRDSQGMDPIIVANTIDVARRAIQGLPLRP